MLFCYRICVKLKIVMLLCKYFYIITHYLCDILLLNQGCCNAQQVFAVGVVMEVNEQVFSLFSLCKY